jgi:HSP20 family protein
MKALVPGTPFGTLRSEMDRLFDRFFDRDLGDLASLGEWAPRLDLSESKDLLCVRIEVPGIRPDDITVTLEEDVLTIRGEKKNEREEKSERYYRMERSFGTFARTVRLPAHVDAEKVSATFKDGVLTIAMPRGAPLKGTQIPVKIG